MGRLITYCGLACRECPAYIVTKQDDNKQRKELTREWSNEKCQFDRRRWSAPALPHARGKWLKLAIGEKTFPTVPTALNIPAFHFGQPSTGFL